MPDLHSADGWKTLKNKFLTYFNPVGISKEQQIKAWKEIICKPEVEKLTDFVFRFSQLAYELGYSDEQQISHFVMCIPRGMYLYLEGAQTISDAVENLRKGIALGSLDTFSSISRIVQDHSKSTTPFMTMKENRAQFTTEDTLRAVKESIQDSRYETLIRLLDKIGGTLANVVDIVEDFQRKQSSRDRDRDRSNSREETTQETITRIEIKIEGTVEIEIEIGLTQEIQEMEEELKHKSVTGQRYFDKNEFCNYCNTTGHATHRCHKQKKMEGGRWKKNSTQVWKRSKIL